MANRGLLEAAVGPRRSDRRNAARQMPEVVEMEAAKRARTLALDEQRRESDVTSARVQPPPPLAGGVRLGELLPLGGLAARSPCRRSSPKSAWLLRMGSCLWALGFANGAGFSKKVLKKRLLYMSGWRALRQNLSEDLLVRLQLPVEVGQVSVDFRLPSNDLVKGALLSSRGTYEALE